MELIAKGWSALKEVDRVIDYCERNDKRLIPLLRVGLFFFLRNAGYRKWGRILKMLFGFCLSAVFLFIFLGLILDSKGEF